MESATNDSLKTFEGTYKEINGKKVLVFKNLKIETKVNADGSKDTVIQLPSLDLVNKHINKN